LSLRLTVDEREAMQLAATSKGHRSISDYIRSTLATAHAGHVNGIEKPPPIVPTGTLSREFETKLGAIYAGDSLEYLHKRARPKSFDLIMTSPPFGLVYKKRYGNEDADAYCQWFRPFADGFRRVLKPTGSLVIEIGGAWKPGSPTRSLYHFELLLMLCREYGFHLAQEHYWWNPSRLPTPAEWVNVRRMRVKDAVSCIWWLSLDPFPRAHNSKVLAPYSSAMQRLLKHGYTAKVRPSGHVITEKFSRDNGGSVPPNLLAVANTESNGYYQGYCRAQGLPIHPARFPAQIPEYFIRFLTEPGGRVLDPFSGSCVTGAVAQRLGRRWVCVEQNRDYVNGSLARFHKKATSAAATTVTGYTIPAPCVYANGHSRSRARVTSA
jgi:DNA modification methylase